MSSHFAQHVLNEGRSVDAPDRQLAFFEEDDVSASRHSIHEAGKLLWGTAKHEILGTCEGKAPKNYEHLGTFPNPLRDLKDKLRAYVALRSVGDHGQMKLEQSRLGVDKVMLLMPAPCQFSGFGLGGEPGDEETYTDVGLRVRGRGENSTRRHVL